MSTNNQDRKRRLAAAAAPLLDEMNVRVSVLEHTVVAQNAETNKQLESIWRVLKEMHDKQDTYILGTSVRMEELRGQITLNAEKTASVNSKVNKFFGGLLTVILTLVGSAFSLFRIDR